MAGFGSYVFGEIVRESISKVTKAWKASRIFLISLLLIFWVQSCTIKCEYYLDNNDKREFGFVLSKDPCRNSWCRGGHFMLDGIDLISGKSIEFTEMNRELDQHNSYFRKGDTFAKQKGQNYYVICKRKYRYYKFWYCKNDESFENTFIDSFYQYSLNEIPHIDTYYSTNINDDYRPRKPIHFLPRNFRRANDSLISLASSE